jgi:hypothetical protein
VQVLDRSEYGSHMRMFPRLWYIPYQTKSISMARYAIIIAETPKIYLRWATEVRRFTRAGCIIK